MILLWGFALCGALSVMALPFVLPFGTGVETPLFLFFGRFHPLVIHLPIGIFLLAALFELMAFGKSYRHLRLALPAILVVAALGGGLAVLHGCLLASGGGERGATQDNHLWAGVAFSVFLFLLPPLQYLSAACACRAWKGLYHMVFWPAFLLMIVASHLGGNLTHGPDYLVKYLPESLKRPLSALPAGIREPLGLPDSIPPTLSLYDALLAPAFANYCVSCHNQAKPKGGLRMDSLEELLKGGDSGPSVKAGDLAGSELHRRVTLPVDDDEFMPPDGKKPLPAEVVTVLAWWIESGIPGDTPLAECKDLPPEIQSFVKRIHP